MWRRKKLPVVTSGWVYFSGFSKAVKKGRDKWRRGRQRGAFQDPVFPQLLTRNAIR